MKFKIKYADKIVGILSLVAIAAIVFIIFILGTKQKWFVPKHPYYTVVSSAANVSESMTILYKGFGIGKVTKIILNEKDFVEVHFYISDEYNDRIKENSVIELQTSPIGLGSSLVFHPGRSDKLMEEDSLIPERSSPRARKLIEEKKVFIAENTDSIGGIINSVTRLINQVNGLIAGDKRYPLAQTINEINELLAQINKLLSGDTSIPIAGIVDQVNGTIEGINETIGSINGILGDVNSLTSDLQNTQGLVPRLLESEENKGAIDQLFVTVNSTLNDLNGISTTLDDEMPQISVLLSQVQVLLTQVQDVVEGVKNNPLIKGGVPDHTQKEAASPKLRQEDF